MNDARVFQRLAAVSAILSMPLAWATIAVGLVAVNYNFDTFSDQHALLAIGASAAGLIRVSELLSMFGYYLLLTPLALCLWQALRSSSPQLSRFYTLCGLAYIFLGAAGAAILAAAWPALMRYYAAAPPAQREMLAAVFDGVSAIAEAGLRGIMQNVAAAIWWLGTGLLLHRERRALGRFTVVLGLLMVVHTVGGLLENEILNMAGLTAQLVLAPLWAIWAGVDLLRRPAVEDADASRPAGSDAPVLAAASARS